MVYCDSYGVQEHQFRAIPFNLKRDPQDCLSFVCGQQGRVGARGRERRLLYFESLRSSEHCVHRSPPGAKTEATSSLVAFEKQENFVAGGVEGSLRVFEKSDDPRAHYSARECSPSMTRH